MKHFATAILALGIVWAALPTARADTTCPPNTSLSGTVNGNLIVPSGARCTLIDVTVTGNVQVQTNAVLLIENSVQGSTIDGNVSFGTGASLFLTVPGNTVISTIGGNIVANQCATVNLENINVDGNTKIQYCTGENTGYSSPSEIAGNFTCNNNISCSAEDGNVKGNMQVNDNGSAQVDGNTIGNNLECLGNATISANGNNVGGKSQCPGP
jgi:hypothetical protein